MKHLINSSIRSIALAFALIMFVSSFALAAAPVSGISIIVKKNPGGKIYRAAPDAKGNFTFKDLPPGKYELSIVGSAEYFAAKKAQGGKDIGTIINTSRSNLRGQKS